MSRDLLRRAVEQLRGEYETDSGTRRGDTMLATADWLATAADLWEQGVGDRLNERALAVARAILGEPA